MDICNYGFRTDEARQAGEGTVLPADCERWFLNVEQEHVGEVLYHTGQCHNAQGEGEMCDSGELLCDTDICGGQTK